MASEGIGYVTSGIRAYVVVLKYIWAQNQTKYLWWTKNEVMFVDKINQQEYNHGIPLLPRLDSFIFQRMNKKWISKPFFVSLIWRWIWQFAIQVKESSKRKEITINCGSFSFPFMLHNGWNTILNFFIVRSTYNFLYSRKYIEHWWCRWTNSVVFSKKVIDEI